VLAAVALGVVAYGYAANVTPWEPAGRVGGTVEHILPDPAQAADQDAAPVPVQDAPAEVRLTTAAPVPVVQPKKALAPATVTVGPISLEVTPGCTDVGAEKAGGVVGDDCLVHTITPIVLPNENTVPIMPTR
jgi:hypothetical protein